MSVTVFSKYDDIFDIFATQYDKTQSDHLTVFDDGLSDKIKDKWKKFTYVSSEKEDNGIFSFSRTLNKCFDFLNPTDVMFYSDDCYVHTPNIYELLSEVAYKEPLSGLVVPIMTNVWCGVQRNEADRLPWANEEYIVLPETNEVYSSYDVSTACFFIRREVVNNVGLFDEAFIGSCEYGDLDYSIRIRKHGYKNIIVKSCFVEHGGEHFGHSDRNTRRRDPDTDSKVSEGNRSYFVRKWK